MRKHLLYLTNTQLTARMWQGGKLSLAHSFDHNENGWQALSDYLSHYKDVPILLLTDLVEEDFQRDTIPHVMGGAKKNLIERRLSQLYRDTPFRHASYQGREKTGRRDDRMLFNALTNVPLIKPWIDAILSQKVPVAGIFSTALLTHALFNKLHLGNEPVLLITHQTAGLRQNFFQDGYLRFSRLIQLASNDADEVAKVAHQEIAKTRQFLANARLLQRGESLEIVALDNAETTQRLQQRINKPAESEPTTFRFITQEEINRLLGVKHHQDDPVFDTLFLTMLGQRTPSKHYALLEQGYAYVMWQLRIFLYALSGVTVAGCLFLSGMDMLSAIDTDDQLWQLQQSLVKNQRLYQATLDSMPRTAINPRDMKAAVELHELITQNTSSPKALFNNISHALNRLPQLQLEELNWEVEDTQPPVEPGVDTPLALAASSIGIPTKPAEHVVIKGEVSSFKNNYRTALESVNQFAWELRKNKAIQVNIIRSPLDIRPSVALTGRAGDDKESRTANFELRISWKS